MRLLGLAFPPRENLPLFTKRQVQKPLSMFEMASPPSSSRQGAGDQPSRAAAAGPLQGSWVPLVPLEVSDEDAAPPPKGPRKWAVASGSLALPRLCGHLPSGQDGRPCPVPQPRSFLGRGPSQDDGCGPQDPAPPAWGSPRPPAACPGLTACPVTSGPRLEAWRRP